MKGHAEMGQTERKATDGQQTAPRLPDGAVFLSPANDDIRISACEKKMLRLAVYLVLQIKIQQLDNTMPILDLSL